MPPHRFVLVWNLILLITGCSFNLQQGTKARENRTAMLYYLFLFSLYWLHWKIYNRKQLKIAELRSKCVKDGPKERRAVWWFLPRATQVYSRPGGVFLHAVSNTEMIKDLNNIWVCAKVDPAVQPPQKWFLSVFTYLFSLAHLVACKGYILHLRWLAYFKFYTVADTFLKGLLHFKYHRV